MFLKGAFKDSPAFVQALMCIVVIGVGFIATSVVSAVFVLVKFGVSQQVITEVQHNLLNYPDLLRNLQFFQVIFAFIFPAIICAWLFSDNYKTYLRIDTPVNLRMIGLTVLSMLVAVPFLNFTYMLNQQMALPESLSGLEEWMKKMEEANGLMLEKILSTHNAGVLLFNILIVCVLTGIGEEFIFRGVLQNIFSKATKNPHVVIWIVAVIFSAIHFQFYGFVTRVLLGAYLGYLLYYTHSIWVPAIAHFTNNLFSVVTFYWLQDRPETSQAVDSLGYGSTVWLAVASFALFTVLFSAIRNLALNTSHAQSD